MVRGLRVCQRFWARSRLRLDFPTSITWYTVMKVSWNIGRFNMILMISMKKFSILWIFPFYPLSTVFSQDKIPLLALFVDWSLLWVFFLWQHILSESSTSLVIKVYQRYKYVIWQFKRRQKFKVKSNVLTEALFEDYKT